MIATVYLPQKDQREYFTARCDEPGCNEEGLPRGTVSRAESDARSRGWETRLEEGLVRHTCAACIRSREEGAA